MRVINMAHGEFIMAGAYVTYVTQNAFQKWLPAYFDAYFLLAAAAGVPRHGADGLAARSDRHSQTVWTHIGYAVGDLGREPDFAASRALDIRFG
jgi:hypothetical protein